MKFNDLQVKSSKRNRRLGRGISSGQGKTAGRGTKGQNSRTGGGVRPGFEGGQNPLMKRLPKLRGFKSKRIKAEIIKTSQLAALGAKVNNQSVFEAGLTASPYTRVALVFDADISKKHTVELQKASQTAVKAVEKAGGSFKQKGIPKRPKTKTVDKK